MDNLPSTESPPNPTVQISQNNFLKTTKGKVIILVSGIILLAIASYILILSYFNILPFSKKPASNLSQPPMPVKSLTLSCPIPSQYCKEGKQINYNNHPALIYQLPKGTEITSASSVVDLLEFTTTDKNKLQSKSLRQTFINNNQCYTLTYTFPSDTLVAKFDLLPLNVGTIIATAGVSLLNVDKEQFNLIIQLQKRGIDSTLAGKPDFQLCSITNLTPNQIGQFEPISISLFQ